MGITVEHARLLQNLPGLLDALADFCGELLGLKLVSLFEPDTEIIRKGKASKDRVR
jgi:hypothetical protein